MAIYIPHVWSKLIFLAASGKFCRFNFVTKHSWLKTCVGRAFRDTRLFLKCNAKDCLCVEAPCEGVGHLNVSYCYSATECERGKFDIVT